MSIGKNRNERFGILGALLVVGALGCQPSTPKQTIESEISALDSKSDYLNLRLNKMEKSIETLGHGIEENEKNSRQGRADLSVAIEDLRTEAKSQSGTVGVFRHDLDEITRSNQKVKEDFDARLSELEQKISTLAQQMDHVENTARATRTKTEGVSDVTRYNQILSVLQKKKSYDAAIEQFRDFIRDYPRSSLTPNAQYWIGEAFYAKADYGHAISEYQIVVDKYPQGEKVCDALLKQGFAFSEMKEADKSRLFFREVQDRCPKSPAALKAAARLSRLAPSVPKK